MVIFEQNLFFSGKVLVFGQKWLYLGKSCCVRAKAAKVVVLGQVACIRAKVVVVGKSGCIRAKVVVFGQKCRIGQSGCIPA